MLNKGNEQRNEGVTRRKEAGDTTRKSKYAASICVNGKDSDLGDRVAGSRRHGHREGEKEATNEYAGAVTGGWVNMRVEAEERKRDEGLRIPVRSPALGRGQKRAEEKNCTGGWRHV